MAVVGIDFGNLNCVIAQAGRGGVDCLLNGASKRLNACVVSLQGKQRFMGDEGSAIARSNFKNTIVCMKRFLGRKYSEPEVQQEMSMLPLKFVELPNGYVGVELMYNDAPTIISMEEATAMMLTKLMKITEAAAGAKVYDAVISIPGYWTDAQRKAMSDACKIAQLSCLRLMHDGTASALAFGIFKSAKGLFEQKKDPTNVLFLDLGNASFTAQVVAFNTGKLTVKSAAYDRNLGGRDFDLLIAKFISAKFQEKHGLDAWNNTKARMKLLTAAEKAKKTISPVGVNEVFISCECLMNDLDFNVKLLLTEFQELAAPLLAQLTIPLKKAVEESGLAVSDLESVEITGGSTRIGFIKQHIAEVLGLDTSKMNFGLSTTMNADEAVSRGCALQAAMLSTRFKVKPFNIYEAVNLPVKVSWNQTAGAPVPMDTGDDDEEDGHDSSATDSLALFKKGDKTPNVRRITFKRTDTFTIEAMYDETSVPDLPPQTDLRIGSFTVTPTPEAVKDGMVQKIRVSLKHDMHGIVTCVDAVMMEEIKDVPAEAAPKDAAADKEPEKTEEKETGDAEKKDAEVKEDKPVEEPPRKKRYRKVPVPVVTSLRGLDDAAIDSSTKKELEMQRQDLLIEETNVARNEVETYIYDMRDQLIAKLREFCTDQEKGDFEAALTAAEDWLYYGDGYDTLKKIYEEKLSALKKQGSSIVRRQIESVTREPTVAKLRSAIAEYKTWLSSSDDKYAHITDTERDIVRKAVTAEEEWVYNQLAEQAKLAANQDPVLTVSSLEDRHRQLKDKCRPILTKPKPKPEKKEEKKEEKEEEKKDTPAEGESKADESKAEEENSGDAKTEDAGAEPMDTEEGKAPQ